LEATPLADSLLGAGEGRDVADQADEEEEAKRVLTEIFETSRSASA